MNITLVDQEIKNASLRVKEGETLNLNLASFSCFPEAEIEVRVSANGHFQGALADFSKGHGRFVLKVFLEGEGATCSWRLGSIADKQSDKVFDTSLTHMSPLTEGEMANYGITEGKSKLIFTGTSAINKGAKGSRTRQEAKIIVFDPDCLGRASPILIIDENDVSASHAAIAGKLNEDHLFYLQSRGLSEKEAKRLMTLGYLNPILDYFEDEGLKKRVSEAIEGGL